MTSPWIQQVTGTDFEEKVISASQKVPVLVDFWAPWCGPCRMLGPILEKVVDSHQGKVHLAKLNTDENPELAARYQIQGIPAVKAFIKGKVVDEFVGALPERQVREFIDRLIPSEADLMAQKALLLEEKQPVEALKIYEGALQKESHHTPSLIGQFRLLITLERLDEAQKRYDSLPPVLQFRDEVSKLKALLDLAIVRKTGPLLAELKSRIEKEPENLEARWDYARRLAAEKNYPESMDHFLLIVKKDRKFKDDGARKAILQLFEMMGEDHPLTRRYREKLAQILF